MEGLVNIQRWVLGTGFYVGNLEERSVPRRRLLTAYVLVANEFQNEKP